MSADSNMLKAAREALGLDQTALAKALGVVRETVRDSERGRFRLRPRRLEELLALLQAKRKEIDAAMGDVADSIRERTKGGG